MPKRGRNTSYVAAGFFALRTPAQPLEALETLASFASDRAHVVERLKAWAASPVGRESLYVASRTLYPNVERWLTSAHSESDEALVRTLCRYFLRSTTRATPFGLFSGISPGVVTSSPSRLEIAPRPRRHARLDMNALTLIAASLEQIPDCRERLQFWPSTSLTRHGDEARYVYSVVDPRSLERISNVATIHVTSAMAAALDASSEGARIADIADRLRDRLPSVEPAEARAFVEELVDRQILISRLVPPLSSQHPLADIASTLDGIDAVAGYVAVLREATESFAQLNAQPIGCPPATYERIEKQLDSLPRAPGTLRHIFQVDLHHDGTGPTLHHELAASIGAGAELLFRIASAPPHRGLERFRERFVSRYGQRRVRLVDALDEERGLGFEDRRAPIAYDSPLFADLQLGERSRPSGQTLDAREVYLFKRASALAAEGADIWDLTDDDIAALADGRGPPDAFACLATVLAPSPAALASGRCKFLIRSAGGPSGANTLGRFCLGNPALNEHVTDHLAREQALYPDDLLAEIIHWPRGNTGNIINRPDSRGYQIVYLGIPSLPAENVLDPDDLLVSVRGGEFILESARLGRRVRPRLTSAHAVQATELPVYQFLAALRSEPHAGHAAWAWGSLLQHAPYLPRVVRDDYVFSEACWNISGEALQHIRQGSMSTRVERFHALREKRGIARWIALGDGDRRLTLDLDSSLCVELLVEEAREVDVLVLREMLPSLDERCVHGSDGTYAHEITVPFVREHSTAQPRVSIARVVDNTDRLFAPGSRWLTLQVYTGAAGVDRVLLETIAPFLRETLPTHAIARWFFIRYGDPDWHLRFRIEARPQMLWGELLPALHERLSPLLGTGLVVRIKVDTYDREIERYGGPAAIEPAEDVFHADSQAVLEILPMLEGDEGAEARWHLAVRGVHDLFTWFGFDLPALVQLTRGQRESLAAVLGVDPLVDRRIGARFRIVHEDVKGVVTATPESDHPYRQALVVLAQRRDKVLAFVSRLDRLGVDVACKHDIALSLAHMFVNRLVLSDHRRHEMLIYDFLWRIYRGLLARRETHA